MLSFRFYFSLSWNRNAEVVAVQHPSDNNPGTPCEFCSWAPVKLARPNWVPSKVLSRSRDMVASPKHPNTSNLLANPVGLVQLMTSYVFLGRYWHCTPTCSDPFPGKKGKLDLDPLLAKTHGDHHHHHHHHHLEDPAPPWENSHKTNCQKNKKHPLPAPSSATQSYSTLIRRKVSHAAGSRL